MRTLFDGPDLTTSDEARLGKLLANVRAFMSDGQWHTLAEIHKACGGTEASCSARLRDLRKAKFGAHVIERQRVANCNGVHSGLWVYRMEAVK